MSEVKERLRASVATLPIERPDVAGIHRRAVRNRRLQRVSAGLLSIGLLVAGVGAIGTLPLGPRVDIRPADGDGVQGWVRVPFGEFDPRRLDVGILEAADVEVIGRIEAERLSDHPPQLDHPVTRLAVAPDGTVAVVSGHQAHLLHPDGRRDEYEVEACTSFERFDAVALDADRRLHLAAVDHLGGEERRRPACVAVVDLDRPTASVTQRRMPVDRGIHGTLLTDGTWWLGTGDERDGPVWTAVAREGSLDPSGRKPGGIDAVPGDLHVDVAAIMQDPNALWQRTGWTVVARRGDDEVGRIDFASRHTWLGAPEGSSLSVAPAGAGRRLVVVLGEPAYLAVVDAEGATLALVGAAAAGLDHAGQLVNGGIVGEDDHLYWLRPDGTDMTVLRYRHPLP